MIAPACLRPLLGPAALCLAVLPSLSQPARAVLVNISGTDYDVLVTKRSLADDPSFFSPTWMPWFTADPGNNALAYVFASAVFAQLGTNTYPDFPSVPGGPLFAYAHDATDVFAVFQDTNDSNIQNETTVSRTVPFNYAYVNPSNVSPVPAPLPLAGVAIALRCSRSLRSRRRRMLYLSQSPHGFLIEFTSSPACTNSALVRQCHLRR